MSPGLRLTPAGRLVLGLGGLGVVAGVATARPTWVAMGAIALTLTVAARGLLVQRLRAASGVAFDLHLPAGHAVTRGAALPLVLRARRDPAGRPLPCLIGLRVHGEPGGAEPRRVRVPGGAQGELHFTLQFPRVGHWHVHGVRLALIDPLGLFEAWGYAALERRFAVHPRPVLGGRLLKGRGARRARLGRHAAQREGDGVELRELRDYVPGDPLRAIAWRATARRRTPVVSAREQETRRRVQLLVDIGPSMRAGRPGEAPLDHALDACTASLEALGQEPVGLTTFDHRIHGHLDPASGPAQRRRIRAQLVDLNRVIDADLTAIARGELALRVGRFLEVQDGLPLDRAPVHGRALRRALVDPLGEQYDPGALYAAVTRYLSAERTRGHAALFGRARPAKDLLEARLRLFCALRGIPLPYRMTGPIDAREQGLRAALLRSLRAGGPDDLWIWTDPRDLRPGGPAMEALGLASKRKRRLVLYGPAPPPDVAARLRRYRIAVRPLRPVSRRET